MRATIFCISVILFYCASVSFANDRLPPNVNPGHYDHQQQQQQQHQQPPPGQGLHPPQPQEGHGHGHDHGGRPLDPQHIMEQREDIRQHYDMPVDTSKMTDIELQFHYFKMHDVDGNNMLDGLELVKSLVHWHDPQNHDPNAGPAPDAKIFPDAELENMIDPILKSDDKNGDGFIDYPEFVQAQKAAAVANVKP